MKNSLIHACVLAIVMTTGMVGAAAPGQKASAPQSNRYGQKQRSVPEPSTMLLVGAGAAAAIGARKLMGPRRRRDDAIDRHP
jgi:hypothetical protein